MSIAPLALLPFTWRQVRAIPRASWTNLVIFAILANICTTLFYAIAQTGIDSSVNGILNSLTPLMTLAVGGIFFRQRLRLMQGLGLLLGLLGSVALVIQAQNGQVGGINVFALFAVLATVCNGFLTNMLKFSLGGLSPVQVSSAAFLVTFPLAFGYGCYAGTFSLAIESAETLKAAGLLIWLAVFANVLGLILVTRLVNLTSPIFASLTTYLMPLVALVWGFWDGEDIGWVQLGAMGLILISVWVINKVR